MRLPKFPASSGLWIRCAAILAGALSLSGCEWYRLDGPQSTITTEGPVAYHQTHLFYVTCWVTLVIFIFVGSTLAYAIWKFRARTEADEHAEPPAQSHGNPLVEIGLIGASVLALVIIAFPTIHDISYTYDVPQAEKAFAYNVTATGYQWWFKFEYPSETIPGSGVLTTGNELVIPAGRPVHIDLRSADVMHSFWIPKLAGKVDMIPNRANFLWLQADHPGYYWGQCAEFCGDSHALMRFRVIALNASDFNAWLAHQKQPAHVPDAAAKPAAQFASLRTFGTNEIGFAAGDLLDRDPFAAWKQKQLPDATPADPALIAQGRALFASKTCIACHTIRGVEGAVGVRGPDLTHVGARTTIAAGLLENNPEELQRWIHNPGAVKPGNKMWVEGFVANNIQLTPADETALVAFLSSLK
ncbi:MAG TPA: cytochrome c oxidase subunit II [Opitutaceae bacterium]|nr:cytochrome c oxidase subunit II [Opitutaceae bacterium]